MNKKHKIFDVGKMGGEENRKTLVESTLRGFCVPGAGIEPARIAPLVFETSASTDSAIRAFGASHAVPEGLLFYCLWVLGFAIGGQSVYIKPGLNESAWK